MRDNPLPVPAEGEREQGAQPYGISPQATVKRDMDAEIAEQSGLVPVANAATNKIDGTVCHAQNGDYPGSPQPSPWAMKTKPVPGAASLDRFELHQGDRPPFDTRADRCEWRSSAMFPNGTTIWIAYALYIMPGSEFPQDTVVGQLHSTYGPKDTEQLAPCYIAIRTDGSTMFVVESSTEAPFVTATARHKHVPHIERQTNVGCWTHWVHEIRCEPAGGGVWNVWRNGSQLFRYAGPIGQRSTTGDYWKFGLYRGTIPGQTVGWYANMEHGTRDLSHRIERPQPLPAVSLY